MPSNHIEDDENENDEQQLSTVGDFKHGSIRRVKLANFLTYNSAVFLPGPR